MESIRDRVALVTGGGRGIGRAIAHALARAGAHVAVAARTIPEIEQVAAELQELGRRSHFFPLDVSDRASLARAPAMVRDGLGGPVEILVNGAGIDAAGPAHRLSDADWDSLVAVNLTAPFLLARACLPSMYERGWGRIIHVAAATLGPEHAAPYVASKQGLVGLTRALAVEGRGKGVTCNALCPGWTDTRMLEQAVQWIVDATGRTREEAREAILRDTPHGRPVAPAEVAQAAVLLARNPAINGHALVVDAGASAASAP